MPLLLVLVLLVLPTSALASPKIVKCPKEFKEGFSPTLESPDDNWTCFKQKVAMDPEAPAAKRSKKLTLHFAHWHPKGPPRKTMVALSGGPGQSGLPFAGHFYQALKPALKTHDLLVVDQRGAGRSGYLSCDSVANSIHKAIAKCAKGVSNRKFYATRYTAHDLEAIRKALEIPIYSFYGVSYGTWTAQVYSRFYHRHTERLILDSVLGPELMLLNSHTSRSILRILRNLCEDNCPWTPDIGAEFQEVVKQLPLKEKLNQGAKAETKTLTQSALLQYLQEADFSPASRQRLPGLIHQAYLGDFKPLVRELSDNQDSLGLAARAPKSPFEENTEFSEALYFATLCSDSTPPYSSRDSYKLRGQKIDSYLKSLNPKDYLPFSLRASLPLSPLNICRAWPETSSKPLPPLPKTPTLILEGGQDMRTSLEEANGLSEALGASILVEPNQGHGVAPSSPCARAGIASFLEGSPLKACPTLKPLLLPPAPSNFSELEGSAKEAALYGTYLSLLELERQLSSYIDPACFKIRPGSSYDIAKGETCHIQVPGLRTGSGSLKGAVVKLSNYSYINGLSLNGSIRYNRGRHFYKARIRLKGPEVSGVIKLGHAFRLVGKLNGEEVTFDPAYLEEYHGS